jgi:hypothetical protein
MVRIGRDKQICREGIKGWFLKVLIAESGRKVGTKAIEVTGYKGFIREDSTRLGGYAKDFSLC